jgi:hypothetical protein
MVITDSPSKVLEVFKAAAAQAKLREVMTDNARELSMGERCNICKKDSIQLDMMVPYHPATYQHRAHHAPRLRSP